MDYRSLKKLGLMRLDYMFEIEMVMCVTPLGKNPFDKKNVLKLSGSSTLGASGAQPHQSFCHHTIYSTI